MILTIIAIILAAKKKHTGYAVFLGFCLFVDVIILATDILILASGSREVINLGSGLLWLIIALLLEDKSKADEPVTIVVQNPVPQAVPVPAQPVFPVNAGDEYHSCVSEMERAETAADFAIVRQKLLDLNGYRDSRELADRCWEEIHRINMEEKSGAIAQRAAEKDTVQPPDEAAEPSNGEPDSGKNSAAIWVALVAVLVVIAAIIWSGVSKNSNSEAKSDSSPGTASAQTKSQIEYDSEGRIVSGKDSKGLTWYYSYDEKTGAFQGRAAEIVNPSWHWGEYTTFSNGYQGSPAEFDRQYDNVIGISFSFKITEVHSGKPHGTFVMYCKTPQATTYKDMGTFRVTKDGETEFQLQFPYAISLTAVRPRPYNDGSWSEEMAIHSLYIFSESYEIE